MPPSARRLTRKATARPQMTHFYANPTLTPPRKLFAQQTAIVWGINGAWRGRGGGQRALLTNKGGNPAPSIPRVPLDLAMTLLLTFPGLGRWTRVWTRSWILGGQVVAQKKGGTRRDVVCPEDAANPPCWVPAWGKWEERRCRGIFLAPLPHNQHMEKDKPQPSPGPHLVLPHGAVGTGMA